MLFFFHFANASDLTIRFSREDRIFSVVIKWPLEILRSPESLCFIAAMTAFRCTRSHLAPLLVALQPFL